MKVNNAAPFCSTGAFKVLVEEFDDSVLVQPMKRAADEVVDACMSMLEALEVKKQVVPQELLQAMKGTLRVRVHGVTCRYQCVHLWVWQAAPCKNGLIKSVVLRPSCSRQQLAAQCRRSGEGNNTVQQAPDSPMVAALEQCCCCYDQVCHEAAATVSTIPVLGVADISAIMLLTA